MGERATDPDGYNQMYRANWEASDEATAVFDAIAEHASTPSGAKEVAAKQAELLRINGKVNKFAFMVKRAQLHGVELTQMRKEAKVDIAKEIKKAKAKLVGHRGGGAGTGSVEVLRPSRGTTEDNNCVAVHPGIEKYWKAEDNNGIGPEQCRPGSNGQLNWRCAECERPVQRHNYRVNTMTTGLTAGRLPVCENCDPRRKARFSSTQEELSSLTDALGNDLEAFNALSPALQYTLMQKLGLLKGSEDSMNRNIAMSIVHGDLTLKEVVQAKDLHDIDGRVREDLDDDDALNTIADVDIHDEDQPAPAVVKISQALAATGVLDLVDEDSDLAASIRRETNETFWAHACESEHELDEYMAYVNGQRGGTPQGDAAIERFVAEVETVRNRDLPAGYVTERFDRDGNPVIMDPTLAQQRFAVMVEDRRRVMNWSGTGAGKTLASTLAVQGSGARETLVVCPKAVVDQWEAEFKQGFPDNTEIRMGLPADGETLEDPPPGVNRIWIANYDKFQGENAGRDRAINALAGRVDAVVYDEIHMAKATDTAAMSQRRERLMKFTDRAGKANESLVVIGASATPVVNNLEEAQSLLRLVEGPGSKKFNTKPTLKNAAAAHHRLASAGVRHMPTYEAKLTRTDDVVDVSANLNKIQEQVNYYRNKSGTAKSPVHAAMMEKALLPYKIPKIVANIKAASGPSVVYTEYVKEMVTPMREAFEKEGLRVGSYTGTESDADRKATLKKFRNGEYDVLIGSKPIATGVDGLQHISNNCIVASMAWTAAQDDQMVGRFMRRGQQRDVNVTYILTEAKVGEARWSWCKDNRQKRVHFKRDIANAAVDGVLPEGALESENKGAEKALDALKDLTAALAKQNSPAA